MQKDVHYYLTHALALQAGLSKADAKLIAWSDQFTDDLQKPESYEIQTQCGIAGDWYDTKTQYSVLIPFHFIPGEDVNWPWKTTENCTRAKNLVKLALQNDDPIQLGISLHVLQDTFSHQGFSGWWEERNSCFEWYHMARIAPNVGHTEMRILPDEADRTWTDERTKKRIRNPDRVKRAAKETYNYLCTFSKNGTGNQNWTSISKLLIAALKVKNYDERKPHFDRISGVSAPRYSKITKTMEKKYKGAFIQAATRHLAAAIKTFDELPWK